MTQSKLPFPPTPIDNPHLKVWASPDPKKCNLCSTPITTDFIDGRTLAGPWAVMCPSCHGRYGIDLGTGKGQHYRRRQDGKFVKIGG